jgi:putative ABC transport system permease protein
MLRLLLVFFARRARGRMALSVAGIALGVALGYGVHLVNRAAASDLAAAVRSLAGEADLEVRGGRTGFAEAIYPRIAKLPGVAVASPALELEAGVAGTERTLRLTGIDILRAAILQPQLAQENRYELLAPDRVFLSAAAAGAFGLAQGDEIALIAGPEVARLKVAGVLASLRGVSAITDVATAQWRFNRLGELNRIDVRLRAGASRESVMREIRGLLPPGTHVAALESLEEASAYPSRSYRVNLNVLAMVALFTGGFLVFSAQALEVARRRGEHALLRVLGLRSRLPRCAPPAPTSARGCSAASRRRSSSRPRAPQPTFWRASPSRCWARCCRRWTPRARRRRARSRRATSRRSFSA